MSSNGLSRLDKLIYTTKELLSIYSYLNDIGFSIDGQSIFRYQFIEISFEKDDFSINGHFSSKYNEISIRFFCSSFSDFKDFYQKGLLFLEAKVTYKSTNRLYNNFIYKNSRFVSIVRGNAKGKYMTIISDNQIKYLYANEIGNSYTDEICFPPKEYEPKYCDGFLSSEDEEIESFLSRCRVNHIR